MSFELTPGPFRLFAEAAKDHPTTAYVLIIGEINRANLAKVFGELYFLLKYRDEAISLQYSPKEDFTLPPNLFVIGTMNTADRSIARIDNAMRRRFAFIELDPRIPPCRGCSPVVWRRKDFRTKAGSSWMLSTSAWRTRTRRSVLRT
jgi:5-methylcytosine-specific restriction protein B